MARPKKIVNRFKRFIIYFFFFLAILAIVFFVFAFPIARLVYPLKYTKEIRKYSKERNLNPALVSAIIYEESHFKETIESNKGARGLMQLKKETGKDLAGRLKIKNYNEECLFDAATNINLGTFLLHDLFYRRYDKNLDLALAAYQAGTGYVDRQILKGKGIEIAETLDYIDNIKETEKVYSAIYSKDLNIEKKKISTLNLWRISTSEAVKNIRF